MHAAKRLYCEVFDPATLAFFRYCAPIPRRDRVPRLHGADMTIGDGKKFRQRPSADLVNDIPEGHKKSLPQVATKVNGGDAARSDFFASVADMNADERLRIEQGERLRRAREQAGYRSARAAALANKWAESTYRAHEAGTRTIGQDDAEIYARRFKLNGVKVTASHILFGDQARTMPVRKSSVVGYALAGGDTITFADGQGPFDEVDAPTGATEKTVAVRIKGTSLGRPFDGWLAFYDDRRDPPDASLYGQLCVCGLADGRVMIKTIRQGSGGRHHLESLTEPTMFDVKLAWAAEVIEMRPR